MFKSLQIKVVSLFVLLVLAVIIIVGTFLVWSVSDFYHEMFAEQMDGIFSDSFVAQLEEGASSDPDYVNKTMAAHVARMGIDSFRNYYILRASDGAVVYPPEVGESVLEKTPNIITAMGGEVGREVRSEYTYMDYAVPVHTQDGGYIVYVKDSKEELNQVTRTVISIIAQTLLLGIIISTFLGYLLSKTISTPISNLTKKAQKLAEGEFGSKIDVKSDDEIGRLTNTFNEMSTQLQETLTEISAEKNKAEAILQNMTDGLIAFDTGGRIIHINPTAKRLLNLADIESMTFNDIFTRLEADIRMGDLLYIEDLNAAEREIVVGDVVIKAHFVVFRDEQNKTNGILCVFHDVTRQQKLDAARREFVANVSHELRTPLTAVKSYAETVQDMVSDNQTASRFTETIINETDRMTRIVKDLLVLSRLDHSKELQYTRFPVDELIEGVVKTMSLVAQEHGHVLRFAKSTGLPVFYGDRDRLEQVLYNIISNAIKYTPHGGLIEVSAGKIYNDLYIKVKDNGIGIPKEDLERIFERFYRVDKARSRESGGTGLGLAIAREIVEQHGGKITLTSQPGKGTEVIISLPVLS